MKELLMETEWAQVLSDYMQTEVYKSVMQKVISEYSYKTIYPTHDLVYRAFYLTPFSKLRVVILGQDPYHDEGQAQGLAFSVQNGTRLPPSLRNIYKELESDLGRQSITRGDLTSWGEQGVLLINSILTVEAHKPASHHKIGWEQFTDEVIRRVSQQKTGIVFILWGKYAASKRVLIDETKHMILESAHPSPLSARHGFFGSKPFSKTNKYLKEGGFGEIEW